VFESGPRVRLALVFGSAAKGRLHAGSDLDVGVIPDDPAWTLRDELDLAARLTRAVGREVDLVRLDRAPALLRWEVARAHARILAEPKAELSRFVARALLDYADMADAIRSAQARVLRRLRTSRTRGAEAR
jgi:predicted nucleotidyltransferase